jgi:hypothetical protein
MTTLKKSTWNHQSIGSDDSTYKAIAAMPPTDIAAPKLLPPAHS